ncbi:MAG: hypothetical protein P8Y16_01030, partial [Sulfurimonas sp.]
FASFGTGSVAGSGSNTMGDDPAMGDPTGETKSAPDDVSYAEFQEIGGLQMANLVLPFLYLPAGTVLYNDNVVRLDFLDEQIQFALTSHMIVTLDDLSFASNQIECASLIDLILLDIFTVSFSTRTSNNRVQEGITLNLYSIFSLAFMNTCIGNQTTNCILAKGLAPWTHKVHNSILNYKRCKDDQ